MRLIILLLLVTLFQQSFAAHTAIITTSDRYDSIIDVTKRALTQLGSSEITEIRNTYDIQKALSRKPSVLVFPSVSTLESYNRLQPDDAQQIPQVILTDLNSYPIAKDNRVRRAILSERAPIETIIPELLNLTNKTSAKIGYIYSKEFQISIQFEKYLLKPFYKVHSKALQANTTDKTLLKKILSLRKKGVTIVRLLLNQSQIEQLRNNRVLQNALENNFSVVITTGDDLIMSLPAIAQVTLNRNERLVAATISVFTDILRNSSIDDIAYLAKTYSGTLYYGGKKEAILTPSYHTIIPQFENMGTLSTQLSDSLFQDTLYSVLSSFADTTFSVTYVTKEQLNSIVLILKRPLIGSFNAIHISLTIVVIIVVLSILIRLKSHLAEKRSPKPVALLLPKTCSSIKLSSSRSKTKRYLQREGYRVFSYNSLNHYKSMLIDKRSQLHLFDWSSAQKAVHLLRQKLREDVTTIPEIIIIFNISRNDQLEQAPRFNEIRLYMFESIPTAEEMDAIFYGNEESRQIRSYIAGTIEEEPLPAILQLLDTNNVTGALLIEDPAPRGVIFYNEGTIVYAEERNGSVGKEAIMSILSLSKGSYRFEPNRTSPVESISLRSMDVLMMLADQEQFHE